MFPKHLFTEHFIKAQVEFFALNEMRYSPVQLVILRRFNPFVMSLHPVQAEDRLGKPSIKFPIGIINAGMDKIATSVGCDVIVKNSPQFKTGKS